MATYSFFGDLILGMSEAVVNMDIAFEMCEGKAITRSRDR